MKTTLAFLFLIFAGLIGFALLNFRPSNNTPSAEALYQAPPTPSSYKIPDLSLDHIFSTNHLNTKSLDPSHIRVVMATGDVIPARSVNAQETERNSFIWPFEKIADVLKSADITFINLETSLIPDCPVTESGMSFCGDQRNLQGLTFAGVDVASLANNHAGNHGVLGVQQTVDLLKSGGIEATGVAGANIAYKEVRGLKFAFLGYNDITNPQPGVSEAIEQNIKSEIAEARKNADVVIVTFHWGIEYTTQPDQRQIDLAHLAIDSGADLVIGNHPHWIEPAEIYKGKLITYAHGNLVFDQMWSEKTEEGIVGKYTFYDKRLVDVEYLPIKIEDYGQPYFLEGAEKERILDQMKQDSEELAKDLKS